MGWATVSPRRSKKMSCFGAEGTKKLIKERRDLWDWPKSIQSCVPVSVEFCRQIRRQRRRRGTQIKTRAVRPVGGETVSPSSRKETLTWECQDCHMQFVKEAENFRVHELVKKIKCHPHREALQASRITSTTHSAIIRRKWAVNWAM